VQALGVLARQSGVMDDRVFLDPFEATGLSHAASLSHVPKDGNDLLDGRMGTIEDGAFAFREAFPARLTAEEPNVFRLADMPANAQIPCSTRPEGHTTLVLTTETAQVVHDQLLSNKLSRGDPSF
jgi:hypothetical protein